MEISVIQTYWLPRKVPPIFDSQLPSGGTSALSVAPRNFEIVTTTTAYVTHMAMSRSDTSLRPQ